ncbi:putative sporulation protein YpjB [Paenibacillus algicola]|uniref:Putative sporulation protein YpjB n=1 Tax=Paenibacillus algicola TaxID=2565926 RepID=A0A4P8XQ82_9BACL|nr:sporulation protein YpjB [Paenibacillus algicola]QCT02589.1 putative sporulation protein YpjB [Paenibacillus algicola]
MISKMTHSGFMLAVFLAIWTLWGVSPVWGSHSGSNQKPAPAAKLQAEALVKETEQLYKLVQEGKVEEVKQSLRKVQQQFEASSFQGLTTVEGIQALAETIVEMKETTARAQLEPEQWMIAAGKLRLAADSLTHPKDGIWLQYYKVLREDLQQVEISAAKQDRPGMKAAFTRLHDHYELIRPAVIVQRKPEEVSMMDSWLSFAKGAVSNAPYAEAKKAAAQGDELLNLLFGKKKDEPVLAPLGEARGPWLGQLLLPAFILAALTFAGYRKYKGAYDGYRPWSP